MHIFALRLRARIPLVSCVHCVKRIVKKDRFLAVIFAETKLPLSALLPFSHQLNLLAGRLAKLAAFALEETGKLVKLACLSKALTACPCPCPIGW